MSSVQERIKGCEESRRRAHQDGRRTSSGAGAVRFGGYGALSRRLNVSASVLDKPRCMRMILTY